MLNIAIILGSTRPGRLGRTDAIFELVDIKDFDLPLLDEPVPPSPGQYTQEHTKRWAKKIAKFDGFVFVTPEYKHGIPAALKNAIDYLFAEWNHKVAGFVGYGAAGGARAIEQLRLVMGELHVADVRSQVLLSLFTDFENFTMFTPAAFREVDLERVLSEVVAWGSALRPLRAASV